MEKSLKAINYFEIKNVNHLPKVTLHGEYLFHTGFLPNQLLKAEIYEEKIIITTSVPKVK